MSSESRKFWIFILNLFGSDRTHVVKLMREFKLRSCRRSSASAVVINGVWPLH